MPKKTHGKSGTPVYAAWATMVGSVQNENHPGYKFNGGQGVGIDPRWLNFKNFYGEMGERPEGTVLTRIDREKGYRFDNCEWTTKEDEANRRRNVRLIEWNGVKQSVSQWARQFSQSPSNLYQKLQRRDWNPEPLFTILSRSE